tara:strand:- start:282 stop:1307 length:1026 start_codon:yes stop_codon:yes gene_type:complete
MAIKHTKDDSDVKKMYLDTRHCLRQGKHRPNYRLPPEAYAFGLATPISLLNAEFHFFGPDTLDNCVEMEDYVRKAGYVDDNDTLIPVVYKTNDFGYREQKDMINPEHVGNCILVTGNSAAFATAQHEEDGFCYHLEEFAGVPVYNLGINNGGSKSSYRIIKAWRDILQPYCTISHLVWDTTRLEFEDAIQVGPHNWKRIFKEYYKNVDYFGDRKSEHFGGKIREPNKEQLYNQMTEIWEKDLELLLEVEKNLNVIWDLQEQHELDVDQSTKEKYQDHENILVTPWTFYKKDAKEWTDQQKEEYFASMPSRDGMHSSGQNYRDCAEKCAEILRSRKWIPSHT